MSDGSLLMLGLAGPEITLEEAELFRRLQPAGYILFTRNIITARQTRKLTDDLRDLSAHEPIIAIDQEGGRVTRTREIAPAAPSAPALAARGDYVAISKAASLTADLLSLLGFNLNFAPVLDLDHHPEAGNALRGRCWGRDSQGVINFAGHWNRWLRKHRMASCGKHFPACGRALSDPHHDLPVSMATIGELLAEDVLPYTALMPELDAVMLAHVEFPNIDPGFPASLSKTMIRKFLRDQLGFDKHLVLTDDLDMGAIQNRYGRGQDAKLAIEAGNDLAMICHQVESADQAASALALLPHGLKDDAWQRIWHFRRKRMHSPPDWSDVRWESTCKALGLLAAEFEEESVDAISPVTEY
jgi:beta-N-acetylhexosaminidase